MSTSNYPSDPENEPSADDQLFPEEPIEKQSSALEPDDTALNDATLLPGVGPSSTSKESDALYPKEPEPSGTPPRRSIRQPTPRTPKSTASKAGILPVLSILIALMALALGAYAVLRVPEPRDVSQNDADRESINQDTPPLVTNPTATNPPATNPPATNPPVTNPPDTNPPDTNPPATNPPVTNPPVTNPPVTNPPVTNPPVTNPPVTNPPVTNPPTVTNPPPNKNPPETQQIYNELFHNVRKSFEADPNNAELIAELANAVKGGQVDNQYLTRNEIEQAASWAEIEFEKLSDKRTPVGRALLAIVLAADFSVGEPVEINDSPRPENNDRDLDATDNSDFSGSTAGFAGRTPLLVMLFGSLQEDFASLIKPNNMSNIDDLSWDIVAEDWNNPMSDSRTRAKAAHKLAALSRKYQRADQAAKLCDAAISLVNSIDLSEENPHHAEWMRRIRAMAVALSARVARDRAATANDDAGTAKDVANTALARANAAATQADGALTKADEAQTNAAAADKTATDAEKLATEAKKLAMDQKASIPGLEGPPGPPGKILPGQIVKKLDVQRVLSQLQLTPAGFRSRLDALRPSTRRPAWISEQEHRNHLQFAKRLEVNLIALLALLEQQGEIPVDRASQVLTALQYITYDLRQLETRKQLEAVAKHVSGGSKIASSCDPPSSLLTKNDLKSVLAQFQSSLASVQQRLANAAVDRETVTRSVEARLSDNYNDLKGEINAALARPRAIPPSQLEELRTTTIDDVLTMLAAYGYTPPPSGANENEPGSDNGQPRVNHVEQLLDAPHPALAQEMFATGQEAFFSSRPNEAHRSLNLFRNAVRNEPRDPVYRYFLALALHREDRDDEARAQVRAAQNLETSYSSRSRYYSALTRVQGAARLWLEETRLGVNN